MRRALVAVMAAIALSFATAACGDDEGGTVTEDGSSSSASGTGTGSASATGTGAGNEAPVSLDGEVSIHGSVDVSSKGKAIDLDIDLNDDYFEPTFVKAAPGATIALALRNKGTRPHTFTIESVGIDQELAPGIGANIHMKLPNDGVIRFACRFHGSTGMQGAFYFTEGGSTAAGAGGGYPTVTTDY